MAARRSLMGLAAAGGLSVLLVALAIHQASGRASVAQLPAIRPLGPIERQASISLRWPGLPLYFPLTIPGVRELPDRRVLVTDRWARRLVLLDSTLANPRVILDSGATDPARRYVAPDPMYGLAATAHGRLFPFSQDRTLFVDGTAGIYIVIGADGTVGPVQAAPTNPSARVDRATFIDTGGRTWQRNQVSAGSANGFYFKLPSDSQALVRLAPEGKPDTIAWLRVPRRALQILVANPMPVNDDWAMLSDGSVALVRAADFHVDWIEPDGTRRSTARLPFDWTRLTDDQKQSLVDSLRAHYTAHPIKNVGLPGGRGPVNVPEIVPAAALPDYIPPFGGYTAIGDADQHLWIRVFSEGEYPLSLRPGSDSGIVDPAPVSGLGFGISLKPPVNPPVYYVIDKQGVVIDRIRVPVGLRIIGFGHGCVYLLRDKSPTEWELLRAGVR